MASQEFERIVTVHGVDRAAAHRAFLTIEEYAAAQLPRVIATPTRSGRSVSLTCCYCHRQHWHGAAGGDWRGPVLSHCIDRPPRSYFLVSADQDADTAEMMEATT